MARRPAWAASAPRVAAPRDGPTVTRCPAARRTQTPIPSTAALAPRTAQGRPTALRPARLVPAGSVVRRDSRPAGRGPRVSTPPPMPPTAEPAAPPVRDRPAGVVPRRVRVAVAASRAPAASPNAAAAASTFRRLPTAAESAARCARRPSVGPPAASPVNVSHRVRPMSRCATTSVWTSIRTRATAASATRSAGRTRSARVGAARASGPRRRTAAPTARFAARTRTAAATASATSGFACSRGVQRRYVAGSIPKRLKDS